MLSIRIKSMNKEYEGEISLRQLNTVLGQLILKNKEITIGKWSERKTELLSVIVFEKGNPNSVYEEPIK